MAAGLCGILNEPSHGEELGKVVLGRRFPAHPCDECVEVSHVHVRLGTRPSEGPQSGRLDQRERSDPLGIGKRELDHGPGTARPCGEVRGADPELVERHAQAFALDLVVVVGIDRLAARTELVVNRLHADGSPGGGQPFLVRYP